MILRLLPLLLIFTLSTSVRSNELMPLNVYKDIIKKLEYSKQKMTKLDKSYYPTILRLGNLYSDQSRVIDIKNVENQCSSCKGNSKVSRKKALGHYQELTQANKEDMSIIMQMAHLYRKTNQNDKSEKLFKKIIKNSKNFSKIHIKKAQNELAQIYFEKQKFRLAQQYFSKSLHLDNHQLSRYRLAWSYLNMGKDLQARRELTEVLKSRHHYPMPGDFYPLVSKDLASFYARSNVTKKEIENLYKITNPKERLNVISHLAEEIFRLGHKRNAKKVWDYYLSKNPSDKNTLKAHMALTKIDFETHGNKSTLKHIKNLSAKIKSCGKKCKEYTLELKNLLVHWNNQEKRSPSKELNDAFVLLLNLNKNDYEVLIWKAQNHLLRKEVKSAAQDFHDAWRILSKKHKKTKSNKKAFIASKAGFLSSIDEIKDASTSNLFLRKFIHLNKTPKDTHKAQLKIAQNYFSLKKWKNSHKIFHKLFMNKDLSDNSLKQIAANGSLGALMKLKDDKAIDKYAHQYAKKWPKKANHFLSIQRDAKLQLARQAHGKKNYKKALTHMEKAPLNKITSKEKIELYKNLFDLSLKSKDLDRMKKYLTKLSHIPNLNTSDKNFVTQKSILVSELNLNFQKAYYKELKISKNPMRLANLAMLSGKSPQKHLKAYLKNAPRKDVEQTLALLIKTSKSPWKTLNLHANKFRNKSLLSNLLLNVYARSISFAKAKKFIKKYNLSLELPVHFILSRKDQSSLKRLLKQFKSHKIYRKTEKATQKEIQKRLKMISQLENLVRNANNTNDWAMRFITAKVLSLQLQKIYNEIIALPLPHGLNEAQILAYKKSIHQSANPYKIDAQKLNYKYEQLMKRKSTIDDLAKIFQSANPTVKKFTADKWLLMKSFSKGYAKKVTNTIINKGWPTQEYLETLTKRLKKDPFSTSKAKNLLKSAKGRHNTVLVSHLQFRIKNLKEWSR